jgi:hypothetical protein
LIGGGQALPPGEGVFTDSDDRDDVGVLDLRVAERGSQTKGDKGGKKRRSAEGRRWGQRVEGGVRRRWKAETGRRKAGDGR